MNHCPGPLAVGPTAENAQTSVVACLQNSPANDSAVCPATSLVHSGFVQLNTEFVLENDLSLIHPVIEKVLELATLIYGEYDESYRIQLLISLEEAVTNAIVHGNLEISSAWLSDENASQEMLTKRPHEASFAERRALVAVSMDRRQLSFVVRDQGPGFQVSQVPDPTAPENIEKAGGRGLMLMRNFMDAVVHNQQGNEVMMVKHAPAM